MSSLLSLKRMLGLWAIAVLASGLALGADRAEALTVTIEVKEYSGEGDVGAARADQQLFHDGAAWTTGEDFEGFIAGGAPDGDTTPLFTSIGTFLSLPDEYSSGTTGLEPHDQAIVRDGTEDPVNGGGDGDRYNTTDGGKNYLDSNDNGGIRLEIPGNSGVGSFNKLSLLATDIDDVAGVAFSIEALFGGQSLADIFTNDGKFTSGTLHLITFLFSESISDIAINFNIDENDGFGVDDFMVSAVPLPAAGWLLLSALAGLGYLGRRRTAVA